MFVRLNRKRYFAPGFDLNITPALAVFSKNETFVTGTGFVLLGIESRNYSVDLYEKNPEFLFTDTRFLRKVFRKQCWQNGFASLWRSSHEKSV
jgi:hypothetical protein